MILISLCYVNFFVVDTITDVLPTPPTPRSPCPGLAPAFTTLLSVPMSFAYMQPIFKRLKNPVKM